MFNLIHPERIGQAEEGKYIAGGERRMQKVVKLKPERLNPAIERANKAFMREGWKQVDIKIGGAALALHRRWGYGQKRLNAVLDQIMADWETCAADKSASTLTMLEAATGIELRMPGEKSYHDIVYLNGTPHAELTVEQTLYMRQKQTKWVGTMLLASVMLSMYRKYGFGAERDTELMHEIDKIEQEYGGSGAKIVRALREETGIVFRGIKQGLETCSIS